MAKKCNKKKCPRTFRSEDRLFTCNGGDVTIRGPEAPTHRKAQKALKKTIRLYMQGDMWGGGS